MPESWRGFGRSSLLSRARVVAEENGVPEDGIDLLDEMETWNAQSLYQWLLENDAEFETEARERLLAGR